MLTGGAGHRLNNVVPIAFHARFEKNNSPLQHQVGILNLCRLLAVGLNI